MKKTNDHLRDLDVTDDLVDWFTAQISPEPMSGCWLWMGKVSSYAALPYGSASWRGQTFSAHRLAARLFIGHPGDRFVCHSCDNTMCVNPSHLWFGSPADNTRDMVAKGRSKAHANAARRSLKPYVVAGPELINVLKDE